MTREDSPRTVGKRIKRLRRDRGLSQRELATPHFTHAYVSTIESGKRFPSDKAFRVFAAKLGVSIDELATGRPEGLDESLELELQEARRALSAGHVDEARTAYREIEDRAKRFGVSRLEAKALHGLGLCEERAGDNDSAIDLYTAGLDLLDNTHPDVRADLTAGKARCIQHQGDTNYAIYLLDALLAEFRRKHIEDPGARLKLLAPLSFARFEAGLYDMARAAADEALRLVAEVDDPLTQAITHVNVARVLLADGESPAAMRSLHKAEELFDNLRLELELGRARLTQGFSLARSGDLEASRSHLKRALTTFREIGAPIDEARTLNELGSVAVRAGRDAEAVAFFESAIELLDIDHHVAEIALAHRSLGRASSRSDPERAEKHLREAVGLYERAEMPLQVAYTYRLLGELMEQQGREAGVEFRAAAMALTDDI